jgi:hypothetical protein
MTQEQLFQCWAPSSVVWSAWVKPVLFSSMDTRRIASMGHPRYWPGGC